MVVGHSRAGAFLPAIGGMHEDSGGLIFVDAVVPPRADPPTTSDDMKAMLDEYTVDGLSFRGSIGGLPKWWRNFFPIPKTGSSLVPTCRNWPDRSMTLMLKFQPVGPKSACGYVRLSAAYEAEGAQARSRGWPTVELDP